MKRQLILFAIISLILVSCKNENRKEEKKQETKTEILTKNLENSIPNKEIAAEAEIKSYDWSKPKLLKQNLLSKLNENTESVDILVVEFLDEYVKIGREFNDILFEVNNYDSLNTLAYAPDDIVYQCAIDFKEKVENNGFSIASSEGMIYIAENTTFIKSEILESLDTLSVEFITLYCLEIDSICCDDAAVIISEEQLVSRTFKWGNLYENTSGLKYEEIAESKFYRNLSLLYRGQENTPSFDWETGKFKQNSFDYMTEIINEFPNSKAAKEFEDYSKILVSENFEKTDKVSAFLKEKFK